MSPGGGDAAVNDDSDKESDLDEDDGPPPLLTRARVSWHTRSRSITCVDVISLC